MTKVLTVLSALVLFFGGNLLKADPAAPEFVQTESNIEGVQDDLNAEADQIGNLPLDTRPLINFNLFSLIAPPTAVAPEIPETVVGINIFPVLDYSTKEFMKESPGDHYGKSMNLSGITLTAVDRAFHVSTVDGKTIGDGSKLSFKLTKKATFSLGNQSGNPFQPLIVSQDPDALMKVEWSSARGPVKMFYEGNFVITQEKTPRGPDTIKVINLLGLEKYVARVVHWELTPYGKPLAVLEAQAVATRAYLRGKMSLRERQGSLFHIFASTQDQYYKREIDPQTKDIEKDDPNVLLAVENTKNKVLYYGGHLMTQAMYSANCAGRSVSYQDYSHGTRIAYLVSVPEHNKDNLRKLSTATFSFTTDVLAKLVRDAGINFPDAQVLEIDPVNLNSSDRATRLIIRGPKTSVIVATSGPQFKALKGKFVPFAASKHDSELRPYMDRAVAVGSTIIVRSYGVGHNVGFCQEGGVLMAETAASKGKDGPDMYKQILGYYYKGATVEDYEPTNQLAQINSGGTLIPSTSFAR
jgi:SpoIID/LytB domain protein